MPKGGARVGAGRPKGSMSILSRDARIAAHAAGILPHEWLLKVSRGEPVEHKRWKVKLDSEGNEVSRELISEEFYADFPTRIDAAKSAAPFYAPRLAVQNVSISGSTDAVTDVLKQIAEQLPV